MSLYGDNSEQLGCLSTADCLAYISLLNLLTLFEVDIVGNEGGAILHFQARVAHLFQDEHSCTFIMQRWADVWLWCSNCHFCKVCQHVQACQHITHLLQSASIPGCEVLPMSR